MVTNFTIKQIVLYFVVSSSKKILSKKQKDQDLLSVKLKLRKLTKKSTILFFVLTVIKSLSPLPVNACSNSVDSINGIEFRPYVEKTLNGYNFDRNLEQDSKNTSSNLEQEVINDKIEESQQESKNEIKESKSLAQRYQEKKLKESKRIQSLSKFLQENPIEDKNLKEPKIKLRKKRKIPMRRQMMTLSKLKELEQRRALKAASLPAGKLAESRLDYQNRFYEALIEKFGPEFVSERLTLEMERRISATNPYLADLDLKN